MTQQESASLENLGAFASGRPMPSLDADISIIDILALLLRRKRVIGAATFLITCAAAIAAFLLPPTYKAEAVILMPQQQQSSLSALAAGAAASGLAGSSMASQLGLKNPSDLYVGLLKSRTIADDMVKQFHLADVYHTNPLSQTRTALTKHVTFEGGKDSLIKITVEDRDPVRAAALANGFIDELHQQNSRLALSDASQRRLFFEEQLQREKDALANAEMALKSTQEGTGLVVPSGQAEVLIRSGAQIQAEIASREVQLQAMRSFATDENPQVQVLKREITALQAQLGQIESSHGSGSKLEMSGGKFPAASLEYIRKAREVKYHEMLFELLAKQYEASRMDEAKQAPIIQVVDRAMTPDRKSGPAKLLIVVGALIAGLVLSSLYVLCAEAVSKHVMPLLRDSGELVAV